jgi:HD superfamily phosphohydrolase
VKRNLPPKEYLRELERKYGNRRQKEFGNESELASGYFEALKTRLKDAYVIDHVLAVGGTGIVHRGHHLRFEQPVVIKINRPNIDPENMSMVANESNALPKLTHPNIIRVLDLGEDASLTPKLSYVVEPYIEGSKAFFTSDKSAQQDTWLFQALDQLKGEMPHDAHLGRPSDTGQAIRLITDLLERIAKLLSQWVDLLSYIHSENYLYLDVKPDNVLVDPYDHLTAIDFGSIERLNARDSSPVQVFYTRRYAHPKLLAEFRDKPSSNRVHGSIKRSKLVKEFDYFALGISILEVLNEVALVREHVAPQIPLYRSLHFLATRLLAPENLKRPAFAQEHAPQIFPGLRDTDYANLAYDDLKHAHRDLEKERGRWNLEQEVPELAAYSKDIVRLVPGFNTVLTKRLRGIIEHPLVARLKYVTQLGLVSLVYPTADHSRYDHALGSYTYTTYYVKSLFNDLGNPLFRNLVSSEDLNSVLLAALLHDLGQYPLAHDLEEVHERIFKHGSIGADLLKDTTEDQVGRTLRKIIEGDENGWNVPVDNLNDIFKAQIKNRELKVKTKARVPRPSFKTNVLAAIVDGQVDADKADYIIRDSMRCELPYGAQLDLERLLRVLTVAVIPGADPVLGVYDKGLVSAHAFGLARYQLLATVYWHHTSRIIKAMLQYATAMGLPKKLFGSKTKARESKEIQIRQQLIKFIKDLTPPFLEPLNAVFASGKSKLTETREERVQLDLAAEPKDQVIAEQENKGDKTAQAAEAAAWYPGISWTDWLMLRWIAQLEAATAYSRNLIHNLQRRRLYKRIATFERVDGTSHQDMISKLDRLSWPDRIDLCKNIHGKLRDQLRAKWTDLNTTTISKDEFDELCESHLLILVDIPQPSEKMGYKQALGIVPELKEKSYHPDTRQARDDAPWRGTLNKMIDGVAPIRVLCHPDVRSAISSVYAPVDEENPNATLEAAIAHEINRALEEI